MQLEAFRGAEKNQSLHSRPFNVVKEGAGVFYCPLTPSMFHFVEGVLHNGNQQLGKHDPDDD